MIRTVGVTQVKYCYRMNINSVQIKFIRYAFHSNQLQAEDASKRTPRKMKIFAVWLFRCLPVLSKTFFVTYWCIFRFEAENKKTELN